MFFILKLSSRLHPGLSSVVLSWGFPTHFDGTSHITFLCLNIVMICRSVNYEVLQSQKSNILAERRMYFEFFTISLNHVLWMFSLFKKCDVWWSNFCIVLYGGFISSTEEDIVYQLYYCGLESTFVVVSGSYVFYLMVSSSHNFAYNLPQAK